MRAKGPKGAKDPGGAKDPEGAKCSKSQKAAAAPAAPEPDAPAGRMVLKVGRDGRLLIPAAIREAMKLEPGGTVMAWLEEGELRLLSPRMGMERAQEMVRRYIPEDVQLADELIEERRYEAQREDREASEAEGTGG